MLIFFACFVLFNAVPRKNRRKINIAPYGENSYYLTYPDKI